MINKSIPKIFRSLSCNSGILVQKDSLHLIFLWCKVVGERRKKVFVFNFQFLLSEKFSNSDIWILHL